MSILISHRKKDNKYRLWTTFSDEWITDWVTRRTAVKLLADKIQYQASREIDELKTTFPNGYWDKSARTRYWDKKLSDKWNKKNGF